MLQFCHNLYQYIPLGLKLEFKKTHKIFYVQMGLDNVNQSDFLLARQHNVLVPGNRTTVYVEHYSNETHCTYLPFLVSSREIFFIQLFLVFLGTGNVQNLKGKGHAAVSKIVVASMLSQSSFHHFCIFTELLLQPSTAQLTFGILKKNSGFICH